MVVREVEPGSPADRAGLKPGEQIREINGVPAASLRDADWALLSVDKLHLIVSRGRAADDLDGGRSAGSPTRPRPGPTCGSTAWKSPPRRTHAPLIAKVRPQSPEERCRAGARPADRAAQRPDVPTHRGGCGRCWRSTASGRGCGWTWPAGSQPVEMFLSEPLPRSLPVHPTQVYSILDGLLLCLLLLAYSPLARRDGEVAALGITVYPITRFLIERLRSDEANILGTGMHISQNISLGLLALAAALWVYLLRQPPREAASRR